jgi:hypothetical protein
VPISLVCAYLNKHTWSYYSLNLLLLHIKHWLDTGLTHSNSSIVLFMCCRGKVLTEPLPSIEAAQRNEEKKAITLTSFNFLAYSSYLRKLKGAYEIFLLLCIRVNLSLYSLIFRFFMLSVCEIIFQFVCP